MRRLFVLSILLLTGTLSRGAELTEADRELAGAVRYLNSAGVEAALRHGANPNLFPDGELEPVLHSMLWPGAPDTVKALLLAGAKTDLEDSRGRNALHAAAGAYAGNEPASLERNLRAILATGVDIHHADHYGKTPLVAAAGNHIIAVRLLLEAGAKVSPAAVEAAVTHQKTDCLDALVKAGGSLRFALPEGRTLMHAACGQPGGSDSGKEVAPLLEKLLAAGLGVDVPDDEGMTPLLVAAASANGPAVSWLTAHGANVKAVDKAGRTALLAALEAGDGESDVFEPLIAAGCPLDTVNKEGATPLDLALRQRWWRVLNLLLKSGAVPRDASRDLRTVLSAWAESPATPAETRGIFLRLLRRIPDPVIVAGDGFHLLRETVFLSEPSLLKAVLRRGVDPNTRDERGRTALMWAAVTGSETSQKMLHAAGADETLRDKDGKTAADLAAFLQQAPVSPPEPPAVPPGPPADLFDAVALADHAAVEKFVAVDKSSLKAVRVGLCPLHLAALNNDPGTSDLLIKLGADPEMKSPEDATPFACAVAAGHVEWCRWFLARAPAAARPALLKEAGASLTYENLPLALELLHTGWKPERDQAGNLLLLAAGANDLALTRELIPFCGGEFPRGTGPRDSPDLLADIAPNARREVMECLLAVTVSRQPEVWRASVNRALPEAIYRGNQEAFDSLLATSLVEALPDLEGVTRESNLSRAARFHRPAMVRALLSKGHKPSPGEGLLQRSVMDGEEELIPLLLKAGAPVDEVDSDGFTALQLAAGQGGEDMVKTLLAAGASPAVKTKKGATAASIAEAEGFPDLAAELEARAAGK